MEFKIEKDAFLRGLYLAQGIADRKSTMPILANVLLRTEGKDKLLVAATDLNVTVTAELPCKVENEGGLTVGAKQLHDIVEGAARRRRSRSSAPRTSTPRSAPARSSTRSSACPTATSRSCPNHREAKFAQGRLGDAARHDRQDVLLASRTDETRYHLNGVLFECDGSDGAHGVDRRPPAVEGRAAARRRAEARRRASSSRARACIELRRALETRRGRGRARHSQTGTCSCASDDVALVGQAHRRAVPAVRAGHPEGEREGRRSSTAPGAPGGAQARQHHVVGQDLGRQARARRRAS